MNRRYTISGPLECKERVIQFFSEKSPGSVVNYVANSRNRIPQVEAIKSSDGTVLPSKGTFMVYDPRTKKSHSHRELGNGPHLDNLQTELSAYFNQQ